MPTECSAETFKFGEVFGRIVVAGFDGGAITSDAGALLLGAAHRAIRPTERFAACFTDRRAANHVEHDLRTLLLQRALGIALGYEDLIDHDQLRHDTLLTILAGKLEARQAACAPLAGKSALNRLELSREAPSRYHRISHDPAAIEIQQCSRGQRVLRSPFPRNEVSGRIGPCHGHRTTPSVTRTRRPHLS